MNNVREAAERLQIYKANPSDELGATWQWGDAKFGHCTVMADIMLVADAYLELCDPFPITPAALEALGFVKHEAFGSGKHIFTLIIDTPDQTGTVLDYSFEFGLSLDGAPVPQITTLGSLKMLLAALQPAKGEGK